MLCLAQQAGHPALPSPVLQDLHYLGYQLLVSSWAGTTGPNQPWGSPPGAQPQPLPKRHFNGESVGSGRVVRAGQGGLGIRLHSYGLGQSFSSSAPSKLALCSVQQTLELIVVLDFGVRGTNNPRLWAASLVPGWAVPCPWISKYGTVWGRGNGSKSGWLRGVRPELSLGSREGSQQQVRLGTRDRQTEVFEKGAHLGPPINATLGSVQGLRCAPGSGAGKERRAWPEQGRNWKQQTWCPLGAGRPRSERGCRQHLGKGSLLSHPWPTRVEMLE